MKLEKITLRNFKSVGESEQSVILAPVTLLFGPNSVGKSTILQSLVFLKEIIEHRNLDPDKTELGGEWLDLGGFKNLVHARDPKVPIEIKVLVSLGESILSDYLTQSDLILIEGDQLPYPEDWLNNVNEFEIRLSISWSEILERPQVDKYEISINGKKLGSTISDNDGKQINIDYLNLNHEIFKNGPTVKDNETKFSDIFEQLVNLPKADYSMNLLKDYSRNRMFRLLDIGSLEEYVADEKYLENLELLREELKIRQEEPKWDSISVREKNRIEKLQKVLDDRINKSKFNERAENRKYDLAIEEKSKAVEWLLGNVQIGVLGQEDALVNIGSPLELDTSSWLDVEKVYASLGNNLRLLLTSVLSGLFVGPLDMLSNILNKITYLGPLRDLPQREMTPQRTPDISRWAKGLAAWELLHSVKPKVIDEINSWLGEDYLNTGYEVDVKKFRELEIDNPLMLYLEKGMDSDEQELAKEFVNELPEKTRVILKEINTDMEMMAQDIGVGISQLLPVIILSIYQDTGIVAVEQPELHIHPRLQVELADLFIAHSKQEGKIFLLETHSEHLLLRLLRRVREYYSDETLPEENSMEIHEVNDFAIPKDHVSVIYVESADYGAKLTQQHINESGDIDSYWPDGFFDERDKELFF